MIDEKTALKKLIEGQVQLPPFKLRPMATQAWAGGRRVDWRVELAWKDELQQFAVEYIRVSTPKNLRGALNQIRSSDGSLYLFSSEQQAATTSPPLPMVMAPYLSPAELDRLAQEEISGIDFCGNGVVIVPGKWLVYRTGQPNKYPSSTPIKKVYQGKSSLVGRVLVLRNGFSQVSELWKEIERRGGEISLGTVSKVLKVLEQELIVSREDGVAVIQPDLLLDRLAANYEPPADLERIRGRLPEGPDTLQRLDQLAREKGIGFAASGAIRYAQVLSSDRFPPIYVEPFDSIMTLVEFRRTEQFANVELRETRDPIVYFDARQADGITWTSPVQTYLDLAQGGTRDSEFAADLRERILGGQLE